MVGRNMLLIAALLLSWESQAIGQPSSVDFKSDDSAPPPTAAAPKAKNTTSQAKSRSPIRDRTRITATPPRDTLPNEQGQVWEEYDIRPYSAKVTNSGHPEQAIVDWILRDTGTELWFTEPLGILNATRDSVRVYHTPEVQQIVSDIVDRFVTSEGEQQVLGVQLVTIGNPNWRSKAFSILQPVSVQSPGVEAWLLSRENAALLMSELRRRTDFREHNSPNLVMHNGQSQTITRTQPRTYPRNLRPREDGLTGWELKSGQIDEGYSLQVSALLSLDSRSIDAVIRCQIDQVEKLLPVGIDVPGPGNTRQSFQIQVPQLVSWRLHERFHWPADQVLLLSCGVVATPIAERASLKNLALAGVGTGVGNRGDALMLVESRGPANKVLLTNPNNSALTPSSTRGRY